ncbi:MAG: asparagine synthase (glutamine-hydrolyzing) [Lachnospiraceae bacterium]|nr:asparagine synthase (glutamine-hydrolyzing) [Lachnospiraceae bacterium]
MCGICGFVSKKKITYDELKIMNDSMEKRGPDDSGVELFSGADDYNVGLAQRRLSIFDLSPLGHQPMSSPDGRITLVFNGEIYNFRDLREELSEYTYKSTGCDTEVILAAYLRWGKNMFSRLDGMFAIGLYDRDTDELIFARDRIGKKPLYYYHENGEIVFASELKPIMLYPGFKKDINTEILSRYLYQNYINAPDSIFRNVYKQEPGTYSVFNNGTVSSVKYWDIADVYAKKSASKVLDYDEYKKVLYDILLDSVKKRLSADVPVGTFLSGGFDSSLVTALAAKVSDTPVKTFCIGFEEQKYNEAPYAAAIASYLGTEHSETIISEKDMLGLVDALPQAFDEPFADSSQIPTMLVSKAAREKVTVILSGDGGDEFFCGYGDYDKVRMAQYLDFPGAMAHAFGNISIGGKKLEKKYPGKIKVISANRDKRRQTQLQADIVRAYASSFPLEKDGVSLDYLTEDKYDTKSWVQRRMLLDMDNYLPGDILCKVDRASMYYSLEARCPILDKKVMEYSFSIPMKYKLHGKEKKYILKDLTYDMIPQELLDRPKKGFSVPLDNWMRGPLKERLLSAADADRLKHQGLFDADRVSGTVRKYLSAEPSSKLGYNSFVRLLWAFMIFQEWYEVWM